MHVRMQEVEIPTTPTQLVGLDFIGPFPPDQYGRKYLLTAIDNLSGWAEAYPTKTQSDGNITGAMSFFRDLDILALLYRTTFKVLVVTKGVNF